MYKYLLPTLLVASLSACQAPSTQINAAETNTTQTVTNSQLQTAIDNAWQLSLDASPSFAYSMGDASKAGQLQDLSPQALAALDQRRQTLLAQIIQIDRSSLNKSDEINAQVLQD